MDWRPFGSLAGPRTRLSLEDVPETFVPADQIRIEFKDCKEVLLSGVKREMLSEAGVERFVLDIRCDDCIPTGEKLSATLVTSKEAETFSGELTIPGNPPLKLPFDGKHWYCIRFFHGQFLNVYEGRDGHASIRNLDDQTSDASQFRFADTGTGNQEFMILVRLNEHALTNNGPGSGLYQEPRTDLKDSQIWTIQAGEERGYYVIKSKQGQAVMTDSRHENHFHTETRRIVGVKPATRSKLELFDFVKKSVIQ